MPLNDIYRVAVVGEYDGQRVILTCHYHVNISDGGGEGTAGAIGGQVMAGFTANLAPLLVATYNFLHVETQKIFPLPAQATLFTFPPAPITGGIVGDGLPGTVALVVTKRTALAGRNRRGRNYVPAIPENSAVRGLANADYTASVQSAVGSTWPDCALGEGGNADAVVYSPGSAPTHASIISYVGRRVLGNQRRRKIGVGV